MTTLNLEVIEEGGGETVILVHGGASNNAGSGDRGGRVSLVGHSFGGTVAMAAAISFKVRAWNAL